VDYVTSRRAEPRRFELSMTGEKVRTVAGNNLVNLTLTFDVAFPDDKTGDDAREMLPRAVQASHDRLCTVSRTVEEGTPIAVRITGAAGE
jgi:putative redox protein